jgi:cephalosporin hydroxylase
MSNRSADAGTASAGEILRFLAGPDLMAEPDRAGPELIEGWVDNCLQGVVRGWAWRPAAPRDPVAIEILVEGVVVGEGVARLQRADLELIGKGACAFEIAVEFGRLAGPTAEATVRAKGGAALLGSPVAIDVEALKSRPTASADLPPSAVPAPLDGDADLGGCLDEVGPDWIAGWVLDRVDPSLPVALELWEAGRKLTTIPADIAGVELSGTGPGDGRRSFAVPVPALLRDDAVHEIDIRRAGGRSVLAETLRFRFPRRDPLAPGRHGRAYPGTIEGHVDGCSQGVVHGWASRTASRHEPVAVQVLVDGVVVGESVARLKRADLELTGKGACAFEIAIDLDRMPTPVAQATVCIKDGPPVPGGNILIDVSELAARHAAESEAPLTTVPRPFGGDAGLGGYLDDFGPDRIAGWIFDPENPSKRIPLEVWEAGRRVATIRADIWRVDIEELRQGDGRWGFDVPVPRVLQDNAVHEIDIRLAGHGGSVLRAPLRLFLPRRDGVPVSPPPPPKRDDEAVATTIFRKLQRVAPEAPLFTFVVNFYNMQREAARTLTSLSRAYQREIGDLRYEVLCIDNGSDPPLDPAWVESFGPEFRLIRPERILTSPCAAINEAARQARGRYVAIMIDGAYVLSPGVFRAVWDALEEAPESVVGLRQWFVGGDQRWLSQSGYTRRQEDGLFDKIDWPSDGYQLFKVSTPARESPNNWFDGLIESNCLFLSKALYGEIGGMNEGFNEAGAGFANLDLFLRAAEASDQPVVVLLGEASFHQFHGGTTTNIALDEMERRVRSYDETYFRVTGRNFRGVKPHEVYLRGQFRISHGLNPRQKPASPARIGVTDQVRPGTASLHLDERAISYVQSAYVELGLHQNTTWLGRPLGIAPADVVNIQDIVFQTRPGRIITVNVQPAILHFLESILVITGLAGSRIVNIAGDPLDPAVLAAAERALDAEESVMVLYAPRPGEHIPLDGLRAYARFVSCRSYLIFLGSVFGQPWLGYSQNWFQKALRALTEEAPFVIDLSRDRHVITTCPMGYLQRTGGLVPALDDDELAETLRDL